MKQIGRIGQRSVLRFRESLLAWYDSNRRDLPWRKTRDPYRIWISEIMLQQTRVAAVLPRYKRFLLKFPSLIQLAEAPIEDVLAEWSGLGYYRRARNLHAAAQVIAFKHAGEFPRTSPELRELPGIGRYTAAAIASMACNEPVAVLDGNVERVLRRLLGIAKSTNESWNSAQEFLDRSRPGEFNQAMMELGATVCLPARPLCAECPVRRFCRTRGLGNTHRRKPRQKQVAIGYGLTLRRGAVLMVQRSGTESLMPGMWELPRVEKTVSRTEALFTVRHSITVTNYVVTVAKQRCVEIEGTKWIRISRLRSFPLTGLAAKILRKAKIIQ
ncbi:MAG TPA: A/G-specific adenine glycosylase [Terriglobales bacterium]|jgi:A/G-specific adenine glycosylase